MQNANVINLEKLIKARGVRSRQKVAEAVGLTRQQIFHYEKGLSEPPLSILTKIVEHYGLKLNDVIDEKFLSTVSN